MFCKIHILLLAILVRISFVWAISVCLDPGHGGSSPGAVGTYLQEKEANLWVALSCKDYLELYTSIEVGLTRETDITLSLAQRTEYANSRGFNWFISIHHNAYNGQVQGTETYRHTSQSLDSQAGHLQTAVHPWLIWAFGYTDRGKKQADFYVLRNTVMPAILGEASFIDYDVEYNESWRFATNWNDHIGREGYAYACGLCNLLGIDIPDYGTPDSLIVDNLDPGFTAYGSWSTTTTGGYRNSYLWTGTTYQGDSATFSPRAFLRGYYSIYIWYKDSSNRSPAAVVEIFYQGGNSRTTVNQQTNGSTWYYLGTYPFSGTNGYVKISDIGSPASLVVVADAVKWVYRSALQVSNEYNSPSSFEVFQNFPNPFNAFTTIPFSLKKDEFVEFELINIDGRKIFSYGPLFYPAGYHTTRIDCQSAGIDALPSGMYLMLIRAGKEQKILKMILEK